jgi:hypothetical protein
MIWCRPTHVTLIAPIISHDAVSCEIADAGPLLRRDATNLIQMMSENDPSATGTSSIHDRVPYEHTCGPEVGRDEERSQDTRDTSERDTAETHTNMHKRCLQPWREEAVRHLLSDGEGESNENTQSWKRGQGKGGQQSRKRGKRPQYHRDETVQDDQTDKRYSHGRTRASACEEPQSQRDLTPTIPKNSTCTVKVVDHSSSSLFDEGSKAGNRRAEVEEAYGQSSRDGKRRVEEEGLCAQSVPKKRGRKPGKTKQMMHVPPSAAESFGKNTSRGIQEVSHKSRGDKTREDHDQNSHYFSAVHDEMSSTHGKQVTCKPQKSGQTMDRVVAESVDRVVADRVVADSAHMPEDRRENVDVVQGKETQQIRGVGDVSDVRQSQKQGLKSQNGAKHGVHTDGDTREKGRKTRVQQQGATRGRSGTINDMAHSASAESIVGVSECTIAGKRKHPSGLHQFDNAAKRAEVERVAKHATFSKGTQLSASHSVGASSINSARPSNVCSTREYVSDSEDEEVRLR